MLVARGQVDEAFTYARDRAGSTTSLETIARLAEETLLQAGRRAEAFDRYALLAKQAGSNQSTVRALAGGYPELAPDKLLAHLIASTPGESGKWFATAKTLTRAARDHLTEQPAFAMQAALAALHGMPMGHGYELTGLDVVQAHRLAEEAAHSAQQLDEAQAIIQQVVASERPMSGWMRRALGMPRADPSPQRG